MDFDYVPDNLLVPGVYVEFDPSKAYLSPLGINHKIMLFGQMLSAGTAVAGEAIRLFRVEDAEEKFGVGSQLAEMARASFGANSFTERWFMPLSDNAAGQAATGTVTMGGTVTAAGTLNLWIGGRRVQVGVASGAALADIASDLVTAIAADTRLAVTAAAVDAVVTLTAKHKGLWTNDLDIRVNYYSDEKLPAGLTATVVAMSGGTANPDLTAAISALGDRHFQYYIMPYTDAANLTAMENELSDRWGPLRPYDGIMFSAVPGTSGAASAVGDSRNSPHSVILGCGKTPTRPDQVAAIVGSVAGYNLNLDAARPLTNLPLKGMLPPKELDRFTFSERNTLLYDGVSTFIVDDGGNCLIERLVTTYNVNSLGVDDYAYRDVEDVANLSDFRMQLRAALSNQFSGYKLASNTTEVQPGAKVARPIDIWSSIVVLCRGLENLGRLQDVDGFKDDIVVELDENDDSRVNILLPAKLIAQLRVIAVKVQFRLI